MNNEKIVCAITGPTYAGKTSLSQKLISKSGFVLPRQVTTRERRIDDIEDYYRYVNVRDFNVLKSENAFIFSSGSGKMSYGILRKDIEDVFKNTSRLLLNISYEDIEHYKLLEYKKLLITLTYKNIEQGIINRVKNSDRKMTNEEIEKRIKISQYLHNIYFESVKKYSDCIIYTDESDEIQTFELTKKFLNKKMGE